MNQHCCALDNFHHKLVGKTSQTNETTNEIRRHTLTSIISDFCTRPSCSPTIPWHYVIPASSLSGDHPCSQALSSSIHLAQGLIAVARFSEWRYEKIHHLMTSLTFLHHDLSETEASLATFSLISRKEENHSGHSSLAPFANPSCCTGILSPRGI